ncbi:MAG: hypothetical protein GC154_02715 [bacterium]|nr:hypothetical protein [bacterium]
MIGEMVEVHLLNGKRFLGKVTVKDEHGLILYTIPVKALESVAPGEGAIEEMREMLHTVFFPWQQIEYVDIGGEPLGFDDLYSSWFKTISISEFFEKSAVSHRRQARESRPSTLPQPQSSPPSELDWPPLDDGGIIP